MHAHRECRRAVDAQSGLARHPPLFGNVDVHADRRCIKHPIEPQCRAVTECCAVTGVEQSGPCDSVAGHRAGMGEVHAREDGSPLPVGQVAARLRPGQTYRKKLPPTDHAMLVGSDLLPGVGLGAHRGEPGPARRSAVMILPRVGGQLRRCALPGCRRGVLSPNQKLLWTFSLIWCTAGRLSDRSRANERCVGRKVRRPHFSSDEPMDELRRSASTACGASCAPSATGSPLRVRRRGRRRRAFGAGSALSAASNPESEAESSAESVELPAAA